MNRAKVAVLQFPGVNCEAETMLALRRIGLEASVVRWTHPAALHTYQAFVLPGGFSYQDRVRAGALAAKDPMLDTLAEQAAHGKPVLGICNGAQVLVEAGLVPGGGGVELALARNRMPDRTGYHARWVYVRVESTRCVFTSGLRKGDLLPLPVAHGEGRFQSAKRGRMAGLKKDGQVPLVYATPDGRIGRRFPDNPNGSEVAAAAVCNAEGNVMALMPHPERAQYLGALPASVVGAWDERRRAMGYEQNGSAIDRPGPGLLLFEGLKGHLEVA